MAWTEKDKEALKKAIASGVRTVSYSDRRVEYRSLDEMLETLSMIEAELEQKKKCRRVYMQVSTGVRS